MNKLNKSSLHEAVRSGDIVSACQILQRDPTCVNDWNVDFKTPLQMVYDALDFENDAQADDRLAMMNLLIDHGADVNVRGPNLQSALHLAVEKYQTHGARFLLENKADPNIQDKFGDTPLHRSMCKNVGLVKLLLHHRADPNILNSRNETLLDRAIWGLNYNLSKTLIRYGARCMNIYKNLLDSCSYYSIGGCKNECDRLESELLIMSTLSNATQIDMHGNFSLKSLMYYAVTKQHKQRSHAINKNCLVFDILRKIGIDSKDDIGNSELHLAVRDMDESKVNNLLQSGANVNVTNHFLDSPLHLLLKKLDFSGKGRAKAEEKCGRIARLLIENGSDLRALNCVNKTPFYLAAKKNDKELVELMLAKIVGVDEATLKRSVSGVIPWLIDYNDEHEPLLHELIVAGGLGHEKIVHHLLDENYIDKTKMIRSQQINTALDAAIGSHRYNIVKMLLEADFRGDRRFGSVPSLPIQSCYQSHLRIACLFWEFNDTETMDEAIIDAFHCVVHDSEANKFVYLLIFYYAIYLRTNKLNANLLPAKGLFKSHKKLSKILSECNKKCDELKEMKAGDFTIFDAMTMPLNSFVLILDTRSKIKAVQKVCLPLKKKKLKYYEYAVKARVDMATERVIIFHRAKDVLNKALQGTLEPTNFKSLPDEIVWNILTRLNIRHLKKIANIS